MVTLISQACWAAKGLMHDHYQMHVPKENNLMLLRPTSDMQQSRATLSHNFVAQQSCLCDIASFPSFDKSRVEQLSNC